MERKGYLIGEVSRESRVPKKTVRYYEEIGLLYPPVRTGSNYRLYGRETIEKLKFIKKAQGLGLTLSEIKGIIQYSKEGLGPCCKLVRQLFTKKIQALESNIKEMHRMRRELKTLLSRWISAERRRNVPLLCVRKLKGRQRVREKGGERNED